MRVIETGVVVPRLAFLTAWDMLDLGDLPAIFGTSKHFWMDDTSRRHLEKSTLDWLTGHGLARGGRVNPMWSATLRVIAHADAEFYGWSNFRDESHGAIAVAVSEDSAVRVLADRDTVTVQPVPVRWPATSLVEVLPDIAGAPVRRVAVAKDFYADPDSARSGPLAEPVDTREVEYLNEVLRRPRDGMHQLYVATRDSDGDRVRSEPISAIDLTGSGRVLTYVTGDDVIVMASGTPREVVKTLNDTVKSLV
ncbi:ESX secretion-associated protein EspG [Amycolatopsis saalfeldensis]|uniref:EspG family protein n=1 Tax=Amycolatopsis saalfeldensis TaxID=394193 RepID=A0A1H8YJV6_9PSEU|nr:ESX secretion-associated protein EspG [Amycolatopsis saalfeldensis]SEP52436.1 EspG family protein [Amycolatopsis saalfeldensis]